MTATTAPAITADTPLVGVALALAAKAHPEVNPRDLHPYVRPEGWIIRERRGPGRAPRTLIGVTLAEAAAARREVTR